MITVDEYRDYLINWCKYEIDKNDIRKNQRRVYYAANYSDVFLQRIIDGTYSFIKQVLETRILENDYFSLPLNTYGKSSYILSLCCWRGISR